MKNEDTTSGRPVGIFRTLGAHATRRNAVVALVVASIAVLTVGAPANAAPANTVNLGTAADFSALGRTVTSAGTTVLQQQLGTTSASVTEVPPIVASGRHIGDPVAANAVTDMTTAYTRTSTLTPDASFSGDQANATFTPGTYFTGAAFALGGIMTLDGGGNCGGIFIFQVDGALNTSAVSRIILTNGAQASNVFWQVNGRVSTGANSAFVGTILTKSHITLGDSSTLDGRALSQRALTMVSNTIFLDTPVANCVPITTVPTFGPTLTGTGAAGSTIAVNPIAGSTGIKPTSVRIKTATIPATSLAVAGQGTWNVQASGTVAFTPIAGFNGSPAPITIIGRSTAGVSAAPATVTATYIPATHAAAGAVTAPVAAAPAPVAKVIVHLPVVSG